MPEGFKKDNNVVEDVDFFGKPKAVEVPEVPVEEAPVEEAPVEEAPVEVLETQVEAIIADITSDITSVKTREEARLTGKPYHRELQNDGTYLWIIEG